MLLHICRSNQRSQHHMQAAATMNSMCCMSCLWLQAPTMSRLSVHAACPTPLPHDVCLQHGLAGVFEAEGLEDDDHGHH